MVKIALFSVSPCIVVNLQPDRTKQSLSSENAVAKTGTNSKSALHCFYCLDGDLCNSFEKRGKMEK